VRRADVAKAERLLGFKAQVDLETGLRTLVQWREETKLESALLTGGTR